MYTTIEAFAIIDLEESPKDCIIGIYFSEEEAKDALKKEKTNYVDPNRLLTVIPVPCYNVPKS